MIHLRHRQLAENALAELSKSQQQITELLALLKMKCDMPRLLLFFCSLFLFLSCQTEEEMIKDKAIETAHAWLQWKYDPMGSIIYTDELVVPDKNIYGEWSVSYSSRISAVSRPFPKTHPDSIVSIAGYVVLDLEYRSAENRFILTNSIVP